MLVCVFVGVVVLFCKDNKVCLHLLIPSYKPLAAAALSSARDIARETLMSTALPSARRLALHTVYTRYIAEHVSMKASICTSIKGSFDVATCRL